MTDTKNNSGYLPTAITEYYGERCEEFFQGCACCEAWREYDLLVDLSQSTIKAAEAAAYRKAADVASGWYVDNDEEDGIGVYEPILALISDDQQSALDAYVKTKVDEHTSKIVEAFRINMMRLMPEYSHEEFDALIRAIKE